MKHLGDITLIKGNEAPVVDCIIGGSPCQDLSVAGKRTGLAGARSGLYMEQIRIIKEMREADVQRGNSDVDIRPRYMVWENVPGAFSTNGGKDFAAVLEEAIRVAEPEAPDVDVPEKGWPTSGCLFDEMGKWSVAWRVLDAQFWGSPSRPLPQRRRRIALVADFGGLSASEILFVRKGVSGNIVPGEQKGKETARDTGEGTGGSGKAVGFPLGFRPENVRCYDETATTLCNGTRPGFTTGVIQPIGFDAYNQAHTGAVSKPLTAAATDSDHTPVVFQPVTFEPGIASREGGHVYDGVCGTLRAHAGDNQMAVAYSIENHPADSRVDIDASGKVQTLTSRMGTGGGNVPMVMEPVSCVASSSVNAEITDGSISPCLCARAGTGGNNVPSVVFRGEKYIVRRLTPLECERLQGYPDGWTDIGEWVDSNGKKHKEADSPRYKALGNSIAIPPWKWVLKRLCACYERDATMASLFDGIGGFPYIWEQLNGKGSCLWASEIEEFPMAVTKLRFGG